MLLLRCPKAVAADWFWLGLVCEDSREDNGTQRSIPNDSPNHQAHWLLFQTQDMDPKKFVSVASVLLLVYRRSDEISIFTGFEIGYHCIVQSQRAKYMERSICRSKM